MSYLWTTIPFLIFLGLIVRYEILHRRRDNKTHAETERYIRPLAKTTGRMYEKQYGRPSTKLEETFPEIRSAK